jgi:spoIIIJ-associated protein
MQDFLVDMLRMMGLKGEVDAYVKDENILCLDISGPDMGVLIGKRGQTLSSLQYLLNIVFHKEFKNVEGRLLIDVEGYRSDGKRPCSVWLSTWRKKWWPPNKQLALEPMNPQDRRIIHTALQDNPAVTTYSEGEEPHRKVIISLS